MDILPVAVVVAFIGGLLFGVITDGILPFFDVPKTTIKLTMVAMGLIAFMFWSTWILPMAIMLLILAKPITITIALTVVFFVYIVGLLLTTYTIGRIRGAP